MGHGRCGQSTLVKQVAQLAEDEKLFTAQVYIDVSWTRDSEKLQEGIAKIQQKIADMLGLEFKGKDESTRAVELKQRLQKEKILIILDDIWKLVCLEEVGIPSKDDQKGCKIVLASRNEDLLRKDMGARVCFPLQHLPKEEAWHLFKKTAGDSVEGDKLRPIAIEVVNECEGLPIAIVTIANALKDESVAVWENALDELRSAAPTNISGVDDKVYGCLKWSYNHLKGDEVKSLFLLCGWLSFGDISMHQLLQYAMGLDLFDHLKSLEQARNKLVTLVRILKASSLLLDGEDHREEASRNIASKDPHQFVVREDVEEWSETDGSKYISLNCKDVHELPHRCKLGDIALIGELKKLQVLSMVGSDIQQLPSEMGQLTNLRLLDLNDSEGVSDGESNACLSELNNLRHLTTIEIQLLPKLRFLNLEDLPELMNFDYFSSDLETTSQGMCSQGNLDIHMPFFSYQVSFPNLKKLEFTNLPKLKEIWHHQPSLEFNNLKKIDVYGCKVLEYAFDLQGLDENVEILPKLETLELQRLPRLRYIICNEDKNDGMRCLFSSPMLMDFQNLKCLTIQDCTYDNEEGHVNTPIEDIVLFAKRL
ncbi:Disease resistance protein [Vitis vinifera]|uniref:Disease resistance protein n=1 Tax=Vitis vinifera TaxID=29760 RepID=A0A438FX67_VITVI|nr:Disease resistance protein [Vitis vinifera]